MDQPMTTAEKASRPAPKWVYTFGAGRADGSASDRGSSHLAAEFARQNLAEKIQAQIADLHRREQKMAKA